MRLIDADKLSQKIETMYLGSDTKENHRVCAETEDTMIGKYQVIDTIFEMPTVDVNGLIIEKLEKIKEELKNTVFLHRNFVFGVIDDYINELKGEENEETKI